MHRTLGVCLGVCLCVLLTTHALSAPEPPRHDCGLRPSDLPAGQNPPHFDAARWTIFTPRSAPTFDITIENPAGPLAPFVPGITSNLAAACARWAQVLDGQPVGISVVVRLDNSFPRATGRSTTTGFVGASGGFNIFEQGAAYEVRTGVDPNGATPDIEITLNIAYVSTELWFDPDPATRTLPVPNNRTDAVSVFLHELGHAVSFNGWRDNFNGSLPGNYMSPFDHATVFGQDFFFEGDEASMLYGASVPLTFGNAKHVGNSAPRPGADLIPDMMNGVVYFRGTRYDISPLDLAVSIDCGVLISGGSGCDSIDFNNDGVSPDSGDVEDYLSVFGGGACSNDPNCSDIDFNNDGVSPDSDDIDALLRVFSGGNCV